MMKRLIVYIFVLCMGVHALSAEDVVPATNKPPLQLQIINKFYNIKKKPLYGALMFVDNKGFIKTLRTFELGGDTLNVEVDPLPMQEEERIWTTPQSRGVTKFFVSNKKYNLSAGDKFPKDRTKDEAAAIRREATQLSDVWDNPYTSVTLFKGDGSHCSGTLKLEIREKEAKDFKKTGLSEQKIKQNFEQIYRGNPELPSFLHIGVTKEGFKCEKFVQTKKVLNTLKDKISNTASTVKQKFKRSKQ